MSLVIKKVCIGFLRNQETLIKNLTFEVKKGKTITLMGPSGCGKSTFLSYICGSLSSNFQANGEIFLDSSCFNRARTRKKKNLANLLSNPHMSNFSKTSKTFFFLSLNLYFTGIPNARFSKYTV